MGVISHIQGTFYVELREDYIVLCLTLSKGEKSKSSPHCKALILAIMERWTNDKMSKQRDLWVAMTYPQWVEALYGIFGRNVIIDSLDELVSDNLLQREAYRPIRGGRDQYKYLLNSQEVNGRLKATFKNQHCMPEQDLQVNHQSLKVNDATSKSKPSSSSAKFTSKPFIEGNNQDIYSEKEREQPASSQAKDSSLTLSDNALSFQLLYEGQRYTIKPAKLTPKVIEQYEEIAKLIHNEHELLSLFEDARKKNEGKGDPSVYLGNLVRELPAWNQKQLREQSNPLRKQAEPTEKKPAEFIDELAEKRAKEWDELDRVEEYKQTIEQVYQRAKCDEADFRKREEDIRQATNYPGTMMLEDAVGMGYESILAYYIDALDREFRV